MSINLEKLFNDPQKKCDINLDVKIDDIKDLDEIFLITFLNNNNQYKDIVIIKGEIFPNPKLNDIIKIDKIYFKYNDSFKFRFYIHASLSDDNKLMIVKKNNIQNFLDFSESNIITTLKTFFNINDKLYTNLFIVDSFNENEYLIKAMENNTIFILSKNDIFNISLNINDIILINDYKLENNKIILSQISIIEKLTDEKLFILLENCEEISNKFLWGKIIEVNEKNKNIIIMDSKNNILNFNNSNNDNAQIGQFFLFSNYVIDNDKNLVALNNNSFYYFSSQDVYFSDKIQLNCYSVIQFHFLDFNINGNNIFNVIKIKHDKKPIKSNSMNFIVKHKKIKYFEIYTEKINLLEFENDIKTNQNFQASIMQGFINKINTFINYKSEFSFYYEYIYYSYIDVEFLKIKEIKINGENKIISVYDDFNSKNRRKFNILNIPFQNECNNEAVKNMESKLICETFYENPQKSEIFGIFNIEAIKQNISIIKLSNNIYDKFYDIFGNIYDYLKSDINDKKEILNFINNSTNKYKSNSEALETLYFLHIDNFDEKISLSQLKTKIGILSSYYINLLTCVPSMDDSDKIEKINDLKVIAQKIGRYEHVLSYNQILRLFMVLTKRKIGRKSSPNLIFLSSLNKNYSPYPLAYEFNLEEIKNLNEYSRLFAGYLQMDSYILTNYYIIPKARSYSFSLEPIFILKKHLMSNYEGFFLTENHDNNIIAWTETEFKITVVNEANLFERSKETIYFIKDEKVLKNHAFGISMINRHEMNSHQKKNLKSSHITSPFYYCDNGKRKEIKFKDPQNGLTGEDGILIESLIDERKEIIISLAKDFIYGELLDYRLFIANNFTELKNKIKVIQENNKEYFKTFESNNITVSNKINEMKEIKNNISLKETAFLAIKKKELILGDQIYSLEMVKKIISLGKKNNELHLLPIIFQEIDEQLNEKSK